MMKETLRALETGLLAEIGLFAFLFAFVLILVRVFLMSEKECDALSHLPLDETPPFEPPHDATAA